MDRITRQDIWNALPAVVLMTLGITAAACILTALALLHFGFQEAKAHLSIAFIVPMILTPIAAFPLIIVSQRLHVVKTGLEGLLLIDDLTEIPNRRAFYQRAAAIFAKDSIATAMVIDIDHFRSIKDRHGHEIGDAVLGAVGHMIVQTVSTCQKGGTRIAARLGGEEFGVLVEEIDQDSAAQLAANIVAHVGATPVIAGGQTVAVTVSIGVAQRRIGGEVDELMRAADAACYRAKKLGHNRWCQAPGDADRPRAASETLVA